jgi:hypothetical protein
LVLLAAGHTLGFLKFKAPTPQGVAVQQAMDNVRFSMGGKSLTYGDFYRGFGLFCTAYLLFAAFLAWHLGTMARSAPQAIGALGWVFFGLQIVGIALSWRYFVLPPTIFSAVLAILTGWAACESRESLSVDCAKLHSLRNASSGSTRVARRAGR